ncbi:MULTISPECIES: hypothetical protein [Streptomyces]|uniref:hypothetical protein n=1 Tax=Streptomyces TaxID=1883 RepID=UPI001FF2BD71|nr:hypothetical protein [Streptomyces sp. AgN23]WTA87460.1 hypothetical protein OG751_45430 [Streptomyces antimycoticus]
MLFQTVDLPTQRRLGDVQGFGGAAAMPVFGDDREAVHQPQIEVHGSRQVGHVPRVVLDHVMHRVMNWGDELG